MSFIDSDTCELTLRVYYAEDSSEMIHLAKLGCDVEKTGKWVARFEIFQDSFSDTFGYCAVNGGDFDRGCPESSNLIVLSRM